MLYRRKSSKYPVRPQSGAANQKWLSSVVFESNITKQDAHGPCCLPEQQNIALNKIKLCKISLLQKNILYRIFFRGGQCILGFFLFFFLAIISPNRKEWLVIWTKSELVEIGPVVQEKKKSCQFISNTSQLSPLGKRRGPSFEQIWIPFTLDWSCGSEKKIFKSCLVFYYFPTSPPLEWV